jgi:hypothetical protein
MRLPGFNASSSLYKTSSHYRIAVGGENDSRTIGVPPVAASPVSSRPEVIHPFPNVLCQPCSVDQRGQCTKYCVFCPGPFPDERCRASFLPCAASECCPPRQDPCYVSGKNPKFCCPPGQCCCDPETNFCAECCGGFCCPPGQACFNGCCATNTGGLTLSSNSNYLLSNGCQNIQGLKISFLVTEPMIATVTGTNSVGGFTIQLNAYSPNNVTPAGGSYWMQYIFWIHGDNNPGGNQIDTQVEYWNFNDPNLCANNAPSGENVCGGQNIVSGRDSTTIPAGYLFEIALNDDSNGNVTSATFTVTDTSNPGGTPVGTPVTVPVPSGYQFPIVDFEVNVVGPDNLSNSAFSSGAGIITYQSSGQLCVEGGLPGCSGNPIFTGETSNARYGTIATPCCASELTQSLST